MYTWSFIIRIAIPEGSVHYEIKFWNSFCNVNIYLCVSIEM